MVKTYLQSIISKYYLDGLVEPTRWIVKDDKLYINFISPSKNLVGNIIVNNFPHKDAEFGIFDTSKLNKLISITDKNIELNFVGSGKIYSKFIISDNQYTVSYSLADTMLISKAPNIDEPEYEIEAAISNDDISAIIKAKTALTDVDVVKVQSHTTIDGKQQIELLFGNNDEYSNKISYILQQLTKTHSKYFTSNYNSELLKLVMNANKEISRAKIYLSLEGLMKIEFESNDIKSTYFLIQNEV